MNEKMIRDALGRRSRAAGNYADVFFQHKVTCVMALEDGAVNSAYAAAELGVGVRVVRGDQTGYGFTEDLTDAAIQSAAEPCSSPTRRAASSRTSSP